MHFETVTLLFTVSTNMVALCTDEVRAALLPYNVGPCMLCLFQLFVYKM